MKHLALIQLQFLKFADLRDDILNAKHSSRKSVFLGGKTDPNNPWREQVKDSLGDKFVFNTKRINHKIDDGDVLVVVGKNEDLEKFSYYINNR